MHRRTIHNGRNLDGHTERTHWTMPKGRSIPSLTRANTNAPDPITHLTTVDSPQCTTPDQGKQQMQPEFRTLVRQEPLGPSENLWVGYQKSKR